MKPIVYTDHVNRTGTQEDPRGSLCRHPRLPSVLPWRPFSRASPRPCCLGASVEPPAGWKVELRSPRGPRPFQTFRTRLIKRRGFFPWDSVKCGVNIIADGLGPPRDGYVHPFVQKKELRHREVGYLPEATLLSYLEGGRFGQERPRRWARSLHVYCFPPEPLSH